MSGKKLARASTKYSPEADIATTAALTVREEQVLKWTARGKRSDEIAAILSASPRTIEKHLQNIFEKLKVETRGSAIQVYYERALEELTRTITEQAGIMEEQRRIIAELQHRLSGKPPGTSSKH